MNHRPYTLIAYRLIQEMKQKGMSRKEIAVDLQMSEDAVRMCVYRVSKDRRSKHRPGSTDRRKSDQPNVDEM